jgi:hypothetical protein
MPHSLYEWLRRVKAVEQEHSAVRLATDFLLAAANRDPTVLRGNLTLRDIGNAAKNLDATYLIRLFAEFETGLRLFWSSVRATDPPGRTRDLLDGTAATRRVPHDQCVAAHAVREYRNSLLHERDEPVKSIPLAEARSHLCTFLSFLPPKW